MGTISKYQGFDGGTVSDAGTVVGVTLDTDSDALLDLALVQLNGDNILKSAGAVTEMTNVAAKASGGAGFDPDVVLGTGANLKESISGSVLLYSASTDFISTPDSAALSFSADSDFRITLTLSDYTPSASFDIITKWNDITSKKSWRTEILTDGKPKFHWSEDGSVSITATSTAVPSFTDDQEESLRITHDLDNGASGNDVKFFVPGTAITLADGTSWDQLGDTVTTAGTTSYHDNDEPVLVTGIRSSSALSRNMTGNYARMTIYNGIDGTLVADMNPADQTDDANGDTSTFVSSGIGGETWTQDGDCYIQNTDHSLVDSIGSVAIENTAGQDIAPKFTAMFMFRFKDPTPGADQFLFDARSDAGKSVRVFSDFSNSNKITLDAGGTPIALTGVYDNDFHVLTVQMNADATTKLTLDSETVTGDAGTETLDYITFFGDLSGANTGPIAFGEGLFWAFETTDSQNVTGQNFLADKYLL